MLCSQLVRHCLTMAFPQRLKMLGNLITPITSSCLFSIYLNIACFPPIGCGLHGNTDFNCLTQCLVLCAYRGARHMVGAHKSLFCSWPFTYSRLRLSPGLVLLMTCRVLYNLQHLPAPQPPPLKLIFFLTPVTLASSKCWTCLRVFALAVPLPETLSPRLSVDSLLHSATSLSEVFPHLTSYRKS